MLRIIIMTTVFHNETGWISIISAFHYVILSCDCSYISVLLVIVNIINA